MATTWDPASGLQNVTLSGVNLTATTTANTQCGARSTSTRLTGKWYFEFQLGATASPFLGIGIQMSSYNIATANNIPGYDNVADSVVYTSGNGSQNFELQNASIGFASFVTTGNPTYAISVDLTAKLIWGNINTGATWSAWNTAGNPAAGTGGWSISAMGAGPYYIGLGSIATGDVVTLDTTGALGVGSGNVPSGFTIWGNGDSAGTSQSRDTNAPVEFSHKVQQPVSRVTKWTRTTVDLWKRRSSSLFVPRGFYPA